MIFLVSHNRYPEPYPVYPLGMAHVATHLLHQGIPYEVSDRMVESDDEILGRIKTTAPKMIAISIRNLHSFQEEVPYDSMSELCAFVEALRSISDAPIVLGGSAVNLYPAAITQAAKADFGIVEDPEGLVTLYRRFEKGRPKIDDLNNIVDASGKPPREIVRKSLNLLHPTELLPTKYVDYYYRYGGMLNLLTRRGCPFVCSFCTYPMVEGHAGRIKDSDRVVEEVERLLGAGVHYFFIVDSVFNANLKHSAEVAQKFIDRGLPIKFCAYMTPRPFPPGYPELLAKAGLTHIEFGTDSFSDTMLKVYRKPFRFSDIVRSSQQMYDVGVFQSHFLILGAPGETLETLHQTFERSREVRSQAFIYSNGVQVYQGTELHKRSVALGKLTGDEHPLAPAIVFADDLNPQRLDMLVEAHAETHPEWVTRARHDAARPLMRMIRERGRIKGPLWELFTKNHRPHAGPRPPSEQRTLWQNKPLA